MFISLYFERTGGCEDWNLQMTNFISWPCSLQIRVIKQTKRSCSFPMNGYTAAPTLKPVPFWVEALYTCDLHHIVADQCMSPPPITVMPTHLDKRMPVGDRFPWICEHLTPVVSTQAVCIVTDSTHSNHLIMAHAGGAGEREGEEMWSRQTCFPKIMLHYILRGGRNYMKQFVR